MQDFRLPIK
jgi:hypothetical protein